ncbi:MAG: hypothetical protein E7502_02910 [Ruminococcus sp.]|nr:hypothetical protein [Ruminococcus sp.]
MPKTIFNTTEKSNFILNMKPEEYQGFLMKILLGWMILSPLFCIPLEFAKVYSVPGMALSIIGVAAMVFVFIGFMKQVTPRSLYLPAGLLGGLVVWGTVSLINSYDYGIALMGMDGRNEGLLSIIFYGCLCLLGAQIQTEENHRKILDGLMVFGLVQCAWGILQALPLGFPSTYNNLEPLLLFRVFLPSGLTGSPIFLAILLSILIVPATLGAAYAPEKTKRAFYLICACVYAIMAAKTQCLAGIAGSSLAILGTAVYLFIKKAGVPAFARASAVAAAFLFGMGFWASMAPSINSTYSRETGEQVQVESGFTLYDGAIIWEDSAYRLAVSGYYVRNGAKNPNGSFEILSLPETYGFLWGTTLSIIGRFPLVGSGPDSLVYPQLFQHRVIASNPNTFDRPYNQYLHIAATLGIPALLLYLALAGIIVVRGAKQCKGGNWVTAGIYGAVLLYLLLMLIGTSSVTTAPVFWMLAGICIGEKQKQA